MKKQEDLQRQGSKIPVGPTGVILLSLLFIVVGVAKLINDELSMNIVYYAVAFSMVGIGVAKISMYFVRKDYLDLTKYGFSIGVFLVILGFCVLIREEDLYDMTMEFFGMLILVEVVILLQYAIQIRLMGGRGMWWIIAFVLFASVMAVLSIAQPGDIFHHFPQVYYTLLCVCGACGLLSMLLVKVRKEGLLKEESRDRDRILEEEPVNGRQSASMDGMNAEKMDTEEMDTPEADTEIMSASDMDIEKTDIPETDKGEKEIGPNA